MEKGIIVTQPSSENKMENSDSTSNTEATDSKRNYLGVHPPTENTTDKKNCCLDCFDFYCLHCCGCLTTIVF